MAAKKNPIKLIALVAIVAVGGYLYLNLGSLITRTAETIASNALGVAVDIGSIDVSLADKTVKVNTLKVGNPPGYRAAHAMTAEQITITLNTASEKLVDFKDIQVLGSEVYMEVNEKGMNLTDLKRLAAGKEQRESAGSEQVRFIIERMVIGASVIHPSISMLDREIAPISLPAINFSGIGKGGAVNAGDAIVQVMGKYLTAVEGAVRKEGLLSGLPGGVGDVKKTLDDAAGGLQNLLR